MSAENHKEFLLFLASLTHHQLKAILSKLTRSQVKSLREVSLNLLQGNIPLTEDDKKKLKPYKKFLRELSVKNVKRSKLSKYSRAWHIILKLANLILRQL